MREEDFFLEWGWEDGLGVYVFEGVTRANVGLVDGCGGSKRKQDVER